MNGFQIVGISVTTAASILIVAGAMRRRLRPWTALGWLLVWGLAGVTIAHPEITATAARRLGITRGADLVFYCGLLAAMFGFFVVLSRLRRIEEDLTTLTRELALRRTAADKERRD